MTAAPLDRRERDLAALADGELDVLVVGGGIVGSGALLDVATRGLRAGLVERDDIAVGTSSRSSRLISAKAGLPMPERTSYEPVGTIAQLFRFR